MASNQITLPTGTYYVEASAPARNCDQHKVFIYNASDTADILVGHSEYRSAATAPGDAHSRSHVSGRFTLAAEKDIELRHYIVAAKAVNGLGQATTTGQVEVYSDILIWKVG